MALTNYERETIITFNEDEETAEIFTYNARLKRAIARIAEKDTSVHVSRGNWGSTRAVIPKECITLRRKRVLSNENREKAAQRAIRMVEIRKAEKSGKTNDT